MFIGNESTKMVHLENCPWVFKIHPDNFITFNELHCALDQDFKEAPCCFEHVWELTHGFVYEVRKNIKKTNYAVCLCCGETRGVQMAHIYPKRFGGNKCIPLCPTCHWNYDHNLLTKEEYSLIKSNRLLTCIS